MADPECREVAGNSHATLLRIETEAEEVVEGEKRQGGLAVATKEALLSKLREVSGCGNYREPVLSRHDHPCLLLAPAAP